MYEEDYTASVSHSRVYICMDFLEFHFQIHSKVCYAVFIKTTRYVEQKFYIWNVKHELHNAQKNVIVIPCYDILES